MVGNRRTAMASLMLGSLLLVVAAAGSGCRSETKVAAPPPPEVSVSQPVEEPVGVDGGNWPLGGHVGARGVESIVCAVGNWARNWPVIAPPGSRASSSAFSGSSFKR